VLPVKARQDKTPGGLSRGVYRPARALGG
jgi:hypothetical protein